MVAESNGSAATDDFRERALTFCAELAQIASAAAAGERAFPATFEAQLRSLLNFRSNTKQGRVLHVREKREK